MTLCARCRLAAPDGCLVSMQPIGRPIPFQVRRAGRIEPVGVVYATDAGQRDMRSSRQALAASIRAGMFAPRAELSRVLEFHYHSEDDWNEFLKRPRTGAVEGRSGRARGGARGAAAGGRGDRGAGGDPLQCLRSRRQEHPTLTARDGSPPIRGVATVLPTGRRRVRPTMPHVRSPGTRYDSPAHGGGGAWDDPGAPAAWGTRGRTRDRLSAGRPSARVAVAWRRDGGVCAVGRTVLANSWGAGWASRRQRWPGREDDNSPAGRAALSPGALVGRPAEPQGQEPAPQTAGVRFGGGAPWGAGCRAGRRDR